MSSQIDDIRVLQDSKMQHVLDRVSIAVTEHCGLKQFGKKRVYFLLQIVSSSSTPLKGQNLDLGTEAEAMEKG